MHPVPSTVPPDSPDSPGGVGGVGGDGRGYRVHETNELLFQIKSVITKSVASTLLLILNNPSPASWILSASEQAPPPVWGQIQSGSSPPSTPSVGGLRGSSVQPKVGFPYLVFSYKTGLPPLGGNPSSTSAPVLRPNQVGGQVIQLKKNVKKSRILIGPPRRGACKRKRRRQEVSRCTEIYRNTGTRGYLLISIFSLHKFI